MNLFHLALACLSLVPLTSPCGERDGARTETPAARGALVIVGGGGTTDAIIARTLELAGGKSARIVHVPFASEADDAAQSGVTFWRERHGAAHVEALVPNDSARARAQLATADLVWFAGGDQNRLMEALTRDGLLDAVRARHAAGAVVGGTSAGAAVLSRAMIVGGASADLTSVRAGGTKLAEGLGLFPEAIVDQHFFARQRFNRLLAAVLDRPTLIGFGIDERTALIVRGTRAEVVGDACVLVIDARAAKISDTRERPEHSARDVRLSVLRSGDAWEWTEK